MESLPLAKITAQLGHFGCNSRETLIYVDVLRAGPSTVQEVARRLKQNRITVHSAAEQLIEKRLVAEARRGKRRLLVAEPPETLFRLLEQREQLLAAAKLDLRSVVEILSRVRGQEAGGVALRFYEGADGLKQLLHKTLAAKSELLIVTDVEEFAKLITSSHLREYYQARAARKIRSRLIWPEGPYVERLRPDLTKYLMSVRVVGPALPPWRAGFFCWDDFFAIKSFSEKHLTCTILESKEIATFYREIIFERLWRSSRELGEPRVTRSRKAARKRRR